MQEVGNSGRQNSGRVEYWPLLTNDNAVSAGNLPVTAPYDGRLLARVETAGFEHVQQSLATAHRLFTDRSAWLPLAERIGVLERCARILSREQDALAMTAAREGGKPLMDSRVEIRRAIDGVRLCVEHLRTDAGSVVPMGSTRSTANRIAVTQYEPLGVVVAVSAFNHPFNLIVHQVAAAVAAGCPVIVKPADETPLSCLRFVAILRQAGLPAGWCQAIVAESLATAESLVTDARVGFFSFIGSSKVGWMLRAKLAPGTRCSLEHGGAAPVFLLPDADLALAVERITKGGFYHAGQVCVSVQRVFVPESFAYEFARLLAERAEKLTLGDPTHACTEVGPLIRNREVARIGAWINAAIAAGAKLMSGGRAIGNSLFKPTVLFNPPHDAEVSRQEIFGPVVCVYSYANLDEAINLANALPFAFQAAVFTSQLDSALHVFRQVDASAVMVNDHTAFRSDGMPFAGLRESGLGTGGIPYTIDAMRSSKMLVLHSLAL